jgi:hypothetical protein
MPTNYKEILGISLSVTGLCLPEKSGINYKYIQNAAIKRDSKERD